jgi:hypothetical protein
MPRCGTGVSSWLPSSGSPARGVNPNRLICPPAGAHSTGDGVHDGSREDRGPGSGYWWLETVAKIRRAYFFLGKTIKAICRELRSLARHRRPNLTSRCHVTFETMAWLKAPHWLGHFAAVVSTPESNRSAITLNIEAVIGFFVAAGAPICRKLRPSLDGQAGPPGMSLLVTTLSKRCRGGTWAGARAALRSGTSCPLTSPSPG